MIDDDEVCGAVGGMKARETVVLGEILPTAALSTRYPSRPDLDTNQGRHGGKPAINCLSYGKPKELFLFNKTVSLSIQISNRSKIGVRESLVTSLFFCNLVDTNEIA
jgi:hypothetical protein